MKANLKNTLPQEGTGHAGESLPESNLDSGCPSYSGGGKVLLTTDPGSSCEQGSPFARSRTTVRSPPNQQQRDVSPMLVQSPHTTLDEAGKRDNSRERKGPGGNIDEFLRGYRPRASSFGKRPRDEVIEVPLDDESSLNRPRDKREAATSLEDLQDIFRSRVGSSGKRPKTAEKTDCKDKRYEELMSLTISLSKLSLKLAKIVSENANTKVELKTGVRDLKGQVEHLSRKLKEFGEMPSVITGTEGHSSQEEDRIPARTDKHDKPECRSVGTQTEQLQIGTGGETDDEKAARIKASIRAASDMDGLREVLSEKWPEEAYTITKVRRGGPKDVDKGLDLVILADPSNINAKKLQGLKKALMSSYPEAMEVLENSELGEVEYAIRDNTTSKKGIGENKRYMFVLPSKSTAKAESIYEQVKKLKDTCKEQTKSQLAFLLERGFDKTLVRKLLEATLSDGSLEWDIKIYLEGIDLPKKATRPRRKLETVTVKGGSTYADMVKAMKSNVSVADLKQMGVSVKSIKKAGENKMLVKIVGDTHQTETFKSKLACALDNTEIDVGGTTIYHISGIEEDAEEVDVKTAVEAQLDIPVQVKSLRPTRHGTKTATIAISNIYGKKIPSRTSVYIGWTSSTMRKRVRVESCYRCWETGHNAKDCQGTDRSDSCRRCGKAGHKAADCSNEQYCLLCKSHEHRAATTGCPIFRKALREADNHKHRSRNEKRKGQTQTDTNGYQNPTN